MPAARREGSGARVTGEVLPWTNVRHVLPDDCYVAKQSGIERFARRLRDGWRTAKSCLAGNRNHVTVIEVEISLDAQFGHCSESQ